MCVLLAQGHFYSIRKASRGRTVTFLLSKRFVIGQSRTQTKTIIRTLLNSLWRKEYTKNQSKHFLLISLKCTNAVTYLLTYLLSTYLVVAFGRSDAFLTSYGTRTRLKTTTWGRYLKSSYSEMCLSAISQLKTHNMCTYLLI